MNEREKDETIQNFTLFDEKELEQVTGGGYHYPVDGCPYGHTKIVSYTTHRYGLHPQCEMGCGYFDTKRNKCKNAGSAVWEEIG